MMFNKKMATNSILHIIVKKYNYLEIVISFSRIGKNEQLLISHLHEVNSAQILGI